MFVYPAFPQQPEIHFHFSKKRLLSMFREKSWVPNGWRLVRIFRNFPWEREEYDWGCFFLLLFPSLYYGIGRLLWFCFWTRRYYVPCHIAYSNGSIFGSTHMENGLSHNKCNNSIHTTPNWYIIFPFIFHFQFITHFIEEFFLSHGFPGECLVWFSLVWFWFKTVIVILISIVVLVIIVVITIFFFSGPRWMMMLRYR